MIDLDRLCLGCMRVKPYTGMCPYCGFDADTEEIVPHLLKPATILGGKYWVGKCIGEGGFGITYIGWDLNLEIKVAIKEYFPTGFATRDVNTSDTVRTFSGEEGAFFEKGRTKFIEEAKALAKFDRLPGIVSVRDTFLENGTAYIVMEFIEGETLKTYLKKSGGKTSPQVFLNMIKPLMQSLTEVHKQGIIHRDISLDNIMITDSSEIILIDFGAAREINGDGNKSLSIQLKPGYAPEEQYRTHGKQGPWTDVYALCATIYRAITGIPPVESLERIQEDALVKPSQMGVDISPEVERVLLKGLAVLAKNRYQSVAELYNDMINAERQPNRPQQVISPNRTQQVIPPYRPQPISQINMQGTAKGSKFSQLDEYEKSLENSKEKKNQNITSHKDSVRALRIIMGLELVFLIIPTLVAVCFTEREYVSYDDYITSFKLGVFIFLCIAQLGLSIFENIINSVKHVSMTLISAGISLFAIIIASCVAVPADSVGLWVFIELALIITQIVVVMKADYK